VISIITENMMTAAKSHEMIVKASDEDKIRVAHCMKSIVDKFHRLFDYHGKDIIVTRQMFKEALEDHDMNVLMDNIGLEEHNRMDLFDAMDADGDGSLDLLELMKGLIRMRGDVKKSDIITSRLVVRSLQKDFGDFKRKWLQHSAEMSALTLRATMGPDAIMLPPAQQ